LYQITILCIGVTRRSHTFINKGLRGIINIKWTDKISNEELWRITKQKPIEIQIKRRKWNWFGHTLRKEARAIGENRIRLESSGV